VATSYLWVCSLEDGYEILEEGQAPTPHGHGTQATTWTQWAIVPSAEEGVHPDTAAHVLLGLAEEDHSHADEYLLNATFTTHETEGHEHDHDAEYDALGAVTTHEGLADPHPTYAVDADLTAHAGAADPHTGYRRENEDHTHATTGAQAGTIDHGALTGMSDDDHPQYALDTDLTTHAGAADPHTGYLKENDANYVDLTDGGATVLHSHAAGDHPDLATHDALGLATDAELATHAGAADPHTVYLKETDFDDVDFLVGTATGHTGAEIAVGTTPGGELGGTWASPTVDATHSGSAHHTRGHTVTDATDHTFPGGTTNFLRSDGTFAAASASLTSASAFATAETTLSAATYADITGCSVALTAGTWLIFAHVVVSAVNAIIQFFGAITHSDNTVISESAMSRPASGTASLHSPVSCSWFAIVQPAGNVTYKLRGARGLTTHTGNVIVKDGTGFNTTNHATNNNDKATSIFALKIA
jgi:hypothetical protein